jgi:hypothetical protein
MLVSLDGMREVQYLRDYGQMVWKRSERERISLGLPVGLHLYSCREI